MLEFAGVTIPVIDMGAATAFYRELLDLEPRISDEAYTLFECSGGQVGLLATPDPVATGGLQLLLRVDDLDRERARLARMGCEIGEVRQHQGYRFCLFSDPDGHTIEAYEG